MAAMMMSLTAQAKTQDVGGRVIDQNGYSVSKVQTAYGIVDIMMHTLERYFNGSSDNEPADGFAEALLRSVIKAAKTVMDNPTDYDARAVLMLMSSLSHNDITSIGKGKMLFVHQIEHAVSGVYPEVANG